MGKPKKTVEDKKAKALLGKRVRFIGMGRNVFKACNFCGIKRRNAMFSMYEDKYYCNEDCIKMEILSKKAA